MAPVKELALLKAAKHGATWMVRLLLPLVRGNPDYLVDALHVAVKNHHPDVVRLLLKAGTPVRAFRQQGYTALHLAASRVDLIMVKLLLDAGADINCVTTLGDTALHIVAGNLREDVTPLEVKLTARELIDRGAAQDIGNNIGNTALHDAIHYSNDGASARHHEVMEMLLDSNPTMTARNNFGHTPLDWAILHRCDTMIPALQQAQQMEVRVVGGDVGVAI